MEADNHEMYKHPPVALVAVEITFPGEMGGPLAPAVHRAVGEVLGEEWVFESVQMPRLSVNLLGPGPMVGDPAAGMAGPSILRFADRQRGSAMAFTSGSVSVETTRYGNWPKFRSLIEAAVLATEKLLRPTGVVRAGLRYIDEIRVGTTTTPGWDEWLSAAVLPPAFVTMASEGWLAQNWTGAAQYRIAADRQLVLRYGPQPAQPGFVVNPDGPLRRPDPRPQGPFFLLDFDASWQPAVVPRWDSQVLLQTCDELRLPVRSLFDEVVTSRLVNEVFNGEHLQEKGRRSE